MLGHTASFFLSRRHLGGQGLQCEDELCQWQHRCSGSGGLVFLVIHFMGCRAVVLSGSAEVRPLLPEA